MRQPKVKNRGALPPTETPGSVGSGSRRDRWRGHREARREELVDAAVAAIRAHGAGVGMDEIAAQAGVSKPILYRHFIDRADLWLAVSRRVTAELLGAMSSELTVDRPPRETIAAVV